MTRTLQQASFNGGELSARMEGRTDLAAYGISAREMRNMLLTVQGPAVKRSGTRYVAPGGGPCELIPFEYAVTQGYVIEALHEKLRFYTNDVRIETAPGVPYEVAAPWPAADLHRLDWAQSLDVQYLVDGVRQPRKLFRTSATTFALEALDLKRGPFADPNSDKARTVQASAASGAGVTLTASTAMFAPGHVGSLIELEAVDFRSIPAWEPNVEVAVNDLRRSDGKVYRAISLPASGSKRTGTERPTHTEGRERDGSSAGKDYNDKDAGGVIWEYVHSRVGLARITAVASGTSATVSIEQRLPDEVVNTGTHLWAHSAFSDAAGWPQAVLLRGERLIFAKGNELFFGVAGDLENFSHRDESGLPQPDLAFRYRLARPEAILWLLDDRDLLAGTAKAEYAILPVNPGAALAFNNVRAPLQSRHGSAPVRPSPAGSSSLFVQRGERKLRAADFAFDRDKYVSPDATVKSEHVTGTGIRRLAASLVPEGSIWALRRDGELVCLTWSEEQEVRGFSRHQLGGPDARVASIASIPAPDGTHDQLWLAVERRLQGNITWTIERLEQLWMQDQAPETGFFVDCGLSYAGPPATQISGLSHLVGETVAVCTDGAAHPDRVVDAAGRITLDWPARHVHAGFLFTARITTMRLVDDRERGSSLSKMKRVVKLGLGLQETLGIRVRRPGGPNEDIPFRSSAMAMDQAVELFTGELITGFPGRYDREARVTVESFQPLPFTLNSIGPRLDVGEAD